MKPQKLKAFSAQRIAKEEKFRYPSVPSVTNSGGTIWPVPCDFDTDARRPNRILERVVHVGQSLFTLVRRGASTQMRYLIEYMWHVLPADAADTTMYRALLLPGLLPKKCTANACWSLLMLNNV